jgi:hypothetical protein
MTEHELDELASSIDELKHAIRKNDPFIREVASTTLLAYLSLALGLAFAFFFLETHFLIREAGSFAALSPGWRLSFWVFLVAFLGIGGGAKLVILKTQAKAVDKEAGLASVMSAIYGGDLLHVHLPPLIAMVAAAVFLFWIGHPWYAISSTAILIAIESNTFGAAAQRGEFTWTGWYSLAAGIVSLFFIEGAPFLWTAIASGGSLLVYAAASLIGSSRAKAAASARGE